MSKYGEYLPTRMSKTGFNGFSVIKGVLWALLLTVLLTALFSLILQFTSLSESLLGNFAGFTFFVSIFMSAVIGARSAKFKGLLHGLASSLAYLAIILIIGIIFTTQAISIYFVMKRFLFAVILGALGGFIGIGLAGEDV